MKKIKNIKGFTLMELLVVIAIMGAVGAIAVGIFSGTLRGGNKAKTLNSVRQDGNYAINQMAKMIAYGEKFEGVSADIPLAGAIFSDACPYSATPVSYKHIKIKQHNNSGSVIFSCDLANLTIASNGASLLEPNVRLHRNVDGTIECNFYCQRTSASVSPTINIVFKLSALTQAGNFSESNASVVFETSVKPRNN